MRLLGFTLFIDTLVASKSRRFIENLVELTLPVQPNLLGNDFLDISILLGLDRYIQALPVCAKWI